MRATLISDQPLQALLPYGRMVDDYTILLHDAPGWSPNGVPKAIAFGAMWRFRQLNIEAMSWSEIGDVVTALSPFIRDLPEHAVLACRMTLSPNNFDEAWLNARSNAEARHHRAHIDSGQVHHVDGRPCRAMTITSHLELRVPVDLHQSAGWRGGFDDVLAQVESRQFDQLTRFTDRCELLERQLHRMGLEPVRLDTDGLSLELGRALDPDLERPPVQVPEGALSETVVRHPAELSPEGYAIPGWSATVYSLHKPPSRNFAGMLSTARVPVDTTVGLNLWELALDRPLTLVTQLALANQTKVKWHIGWQRWVGGFFRRQSTGVESTDVAVVADSLDRFATALASQQDVAVLMSTHVILWHREGEASLGDAALRYAGQRVGLEFLPETLEGHVMFLKALPLGNSMTCPPESWLRRMRTFPLHDALNLMPQLGGFNGYGERSMGIRLLNERGEIVHFHPLRDNHRPHGVIVGSNRSGKSAFANWLAHCLLPLLAIFIFFDRHGSYEALCKLHRGRHVRFSRESPICLGPFDGDLGPDHQDLLLTIMAEMATRVNRVIPQASTTLTNAQGLVLAQQLKRWAESGDIVSTPQLGQFAKYLESVREDKAICHELAILLSPYCNDGPFAPFIDGPAELTIEPGLLSLDVQPLVNAGPLASVITATLVGWVDSFVVDPQYAALDKFVVMDEVAADLKSPQAALLIERMARGYARYNAALWLISQNMSDFQGEIGEIIQGQGGAFISFALNADEAELFCRTFTPNAPHIEPLLKRLKPHEDCSQGFIYLPDGGGGAFRVVTDPEFMMQIGQSPYHRALREKAIEHAI